MKRKVLSVLLATAMTATLFAGCGDSSDDAASSTAGTEAGSAEATGDSATTGTGSVYMLNFKPEVDQQWKDLAAIYTELSG